MARLIRNINLLFIKACALFIMALSSQVRNDMSWNLYTNDGEIAQISYANTGISRALPVVSWCEESSDITVIISASLLPSSLCLSSAFIGRSQVLENDFVIAITGYIPDMRQLQVQCAFIYFNYLNTHGSSPNIDYMCNKLSTWLTLGLYPKSDDEASFQDILTTRPYALSCLISSYDKTERKAKLYLLENSGVFRDCHFATLGKISHSCIPKLKQIALDELSKSSMVEKHVDRMNWKIPRIRAFADRFKLPAAAVVKSSRVLAALLDDLASSSASQFDVSSSSSERHSHGESRESNYANGNLLQFQIAVVGPHACGSIVLTANEVTSLAALANDEAPDRSAPPSY